MLAAERQAMIVELIRENGSVHHRRRAGGRRGS